MWLDNASSIDMLFYSPYANTIVSFTKNAYLTPMTIGLYGSWGAGKSSLLQLIEQRIEDDRDDDVVCVSLNAWHAQWLLMKDSPMITAIVSESVSALLAGSEVMPCCTCSHMRSVALSICMFLARYSPFVKLSLWSMRYTLASAVLPLSCALHIRKRS